MEYHFRNLVFEGGGVKGIAYAGVLEVLASKGILHNITRVGGSSAGAIVAVLVGLGYSVPEINRELKELDFNSFLDDSLGVIRDVNRLLNQFGWYKGDVFRDWMAEIIARKTGDRDATFRYVYLQKEAKGFRDIYLTGTNLSTGFSEIFSYEHTPDMKIADAARYSMSIPLFFAAQKNKDGAVYIDGGVLDNYPIKLFDRTHYIEKYSRATDYYNKQNEKLLQVQTEDKFSPFVYNKETLGLHLDSPKELVALQEPLKLDGNIVNNFLDYMFKLVKVFMESQLNQHLHSDDWQRTIHINTLEVRTTDFGITDERKEALVDSGRQCTKRYFDWYDYHQETAPPINSPKSDNISSPAS